MLTSTDTLSPSSQIAATRLVEVTRSLAAGETPGDRAQILTLIDIALQAPRLAPHLVEAVLDSCVARFPQAYAHVATHRADPNWSRPYPLGVQEYSVIFKEAPMLHLGLLAGLQQTTWPRQALQALRRSVDAGDTHVVHIAQTLQDDFDSIGQEAAEMVDRLTTIRAIKKNSSMHVVQIEAYLSATLIEGSLGGYNCCDLGAGNGELVEYLQKEGARACGTETELAGPGLLGIAEQPRFDVVFATGFMEPGAFQWPGSGVNMIEYNNRADEILLAAARLLRPRGLLVVRNVSHPLPFSGRAVTSANLVAQHVIMPQCTPSFSGRLAVWRKI